MGMGTDMQVWIPVLVLTGQPMGSMGTGTGTAKNTWGASGHWGLPVQFTSY